MSGWKVKLYYLTRIDKCIFVCIWLTGCIWLFSLMHQIWFQKLLLFFKLVLSVSYFLILPLSKSKASFVLSIVEYKVFFFVICSSFICEFSAIWFIFFWFHKCYIQAKSLMLNFILLIPPTLKIIWLVVVIILIDALERSQCPHN